MDRLEYRQKILNQSICKLVSLLVRLVEARHDHFS